MIQIAVCDDNIVQVRKIESLLEKYFSEEKLPHELFSYTDSSLLVEDSKKYSFDIAFLDVEMKPINGIETGEYLRKAIPNIILIYVSGYIDYSVQGYKVQAFRYILKRDLDALFKEDMDAALLQYRRINDCFTYKKDGETVRIAYRDILYLMSSERKVTVYTDNGETDTFYAKLDDLEKRFEYHNFLRVQQSYLVNLKYALKLSNYNIYLRNNIVIPVSKRNYQQLRLKYTEMKGRM
ncbi:MAG: LytR/AlgR family response regulator transcription factor [Erysipelotrichaceae bacterium]